MIRMWKKSSDIVAGVLIPKYYDPSIPNDLSRLQRTHKCHTVQQLLIDNTVSITSGHEIGKAGYGTGDIPFIRTSDICNWEINAFAKQGVSEEIYSKYLSKQDVRPGDILFVRDGTYLIGTNCLVAELDKRLLLQSHILRIRIDDTNRFPTELFFLSLNSPIVQRQIRSKQFTADIIDTIGNRFHEVVIPIPKDKNTRERLRLATREALQAREKGKAFVKNAPRILEKVLWKGSVAPLDDFASLSPADIVESTYCHTLRSEFGLFTSFWIRSSEIRQRCFLPKVYDPSVQIELEALSGSCQLVRMSELRTSGAISYNTGDEIGKMAYGTGNIPFIRTSDFANWEIKHDPKHSISEEIFHQYATVQDVKENDILLVRDGTYLVGTSCIITSQDVRSLFCAGLFKIRVKESDFLDPFLFLGLLNTFTVKRQFRTKQFTRDVIDTLGNRLDEVVVPIPKSRKVRQAIGQRIRTVIEQRIEARSVISQMSKEITARQSNTSLDGICV